MIRDVAHPAFLDEQLAADASNRVTWRPLAQRMCGPPALRRCGRDSVPPSSGGTDQGGPLEKQPFIARTPATTVLQRVIDQRVRDVHPEQITAYRRAVSVRPDNAPVATGRLFDGSWI